MSSASNNKKKDSFFGLHFTSIISISLVLFMVGLVSIIVLSARIITIDTKENMPVSVILQDSIGEENLERLTHYLSESYFTKEVVYVSKDSALTEHIEALGDNPEEFLGFNPLSASLEVSLKSEYANADSVNSIVVPKVMEFEGVADIAYSEDLMQLFNSNLQKASILIGLIAIVLLFISVVLINNTIRLIIYSKRFLLNTMMLVGAKKSFIRAPFLRRALLNGFISSLIALGMLGASVYYVQSQIAASFSLYNMEIIVPTVLLIVVLGLFITYFASRMSVNKYVKMKTSKLYFV